MFLQEEYLKRHEITDIPIVHHVQNGSLFLEPNQLMTVTWKYLPRCPGKYYINYYCPIQNKNECFQRIAESERQLEWDEYSNYLINWSKWQESKPIIDTKEVFSKTWEMFCFCCNYNILNKSITNYEEELEPELLNIFKNQFLHHINQYADWLGKLILFWRN